MKYLTKFFLMICMSFYFISCSSANYQSKVLLVSPDNFAIVKYNKFSGETWVVFNDKWRKIREKIKLKKSIYSIEIASEGKNGTLMVLRLDLQSGKAWESGNYEWVEIPEENVQE